MTKRGKKRSATSHNNNGQFKEKNILNKRQKNKFIEVCEGISFTFKSSSVGRLFSLA